MSHSALELTRLSHRADCKARGQMVDMPAGPAHPPRLAVHAASPRPPDSAGLFSPTLVEPSPPPKPSRNSLFDLDWGTLSPAPPPRSRSSTAESQFSESSSATGASTGASTAASSVRRSWMDVDYSPPLQSTIPAAVGLAAPTLVPPPPLDRSETYQLRLDTTPVPGAKGDAGFDWPLTPPSPTAQPPRPFPTLPPFQPSPPFVAVTSLSHAPVPPSSPSIASTASPPLSSTRPSFPHRISSTSSNPPDPCAPLPPTAGHSSNPLLDTRRSPALRMAPTPPYLLGEGRHATVYLASYARPGDAHEPWRLCAAKRLAPDRESQVSGLGEAFILAKLAGAGPACGDERREGGSRFVLRLYGVRDERDGLEAPLALAAVSQAGSAAVSRRASASSGSKRWSVGSMGSAGSPRAAEGTSGVPPSPLGRTFPDVTDRLDVPLSPGERRRPLSLKLDGETSPGARKKASSRHSDLSQLGHGHSRLSLLSHALEPPLSSSKRRITLSGAATTIPGAPASPASPPSALAPALPISPSSTPQLGPALAPVPRIDILLEYCPRGHVLQFARCHPDLVDKARWIDWAGQLASAVSWAHEKGVLHADIKPQNVLVAPDLTLRLSDWGTSLFLPPPSSPLHRFPTDPHGLGTPSYSPPEFVQRLPSPFGYASDVFSLALTLSTLLTAREPYDGLRAVERMLHVASGGWWEWEERRRLREEGDEAEVALSRAGSVRSTRSAASRRGGRTRSDSLESVRSVVSNAPDALSGPHDWDAVKRSLLLVDQDDSAFDAVERDRTSLASSQPHSPVGELDDDPPTRTYPGTATPVQYFLSGTRAPQDVVPLAARELLRRMASPAPSARPSAAEVVDELRRLARAEGVDVSW
ncbi:hypothetical protein JCM8208_005196 [Rhodotorula glutinis]